MASCATSSCAGRGEHGRATRPWKRVETRGCLPLETRLLPCGGRSHMLSPSRLLDPQGSGGGRTADPTSCVRAAPSSTTARPRSPRTPRPPPLDPPGIHSNPTPCAISRARSCASPGTSAKVRAERPVVLVAAGLAAQLQFPRRPARPDGRAWRYGFFLALLDGRSCRRRSLSSRWRVSSSTRRRAAARSPPSARR